MATVAIVHRLDKKNKKNQAPIHFRIIQNRQISYIASGVMLTEEEWDQSKLKVTAKNKNSKRLTAYILDKFLEIQRNVIEQETINKSMTPKKLKEKAWGTKPTNIFLFADEFILKYRDKGDISSYEKCKAIMHKLEIYLGNRDLCFQDIDVPFLTKYEKYLRTVIGNAQNTIHTNLKVFRTLFNEALRQEIIGHSDIPFNKYVLKSEKTQRVFLTNEELSAVENVKLPTGSKQALYRDMFIFSAYTGGIRISDMLLMKWKHFDGTHIHFKIKKTSSQLTIKLPQKALEILFEYMPDKRFPEKYIFPVLPDELNIEDALELHNAISRGTSLVNNALNKIAKKAGITTHISFHIARHTWATQALRRGISIDKVSKLMGHANIRETQVYAKIVNEELDKAMEVFND